MNVYEKLAKVRVDLQSAGLKKTGNNKFAGYTYFELGDFLPTVNKLCLENKLLTRTYFNDGLATLEVVNAEAPDEVIVFTSPIAEANLKGCHPVQNVGAMETYERRYLMMLAFEIVECDALDSTQGKPQKDPDRDAKCVLTQAQIKRFFTLAAQAGFTSDKAEAQLQKAFGVGSVKELTKEQYEKATKGYEDLIAKKGGK